MPIDTVSQMIVEENSRNFDISIGALAQLTYSPISCFGVGLNFGAGLSPLDGKTRLLMGGHLQFGRKNRIVLSGGAALAKMKVLSGQVSDDNSTPETVPASLTAVPTFEKQV